MTGPMVMVILPQVIPIWIDSIQGPKWPKVLWAWAGFSGSFREVFMMGLSFGEKQLRCIVTLPLWRKLQVWTSLSFELVSFKVSIQVLVTLICYPRQPEQSLKKNLLKAGFSWRFPPMSLLYPSLSSWSLCMSVLSWYHLLSNFFSFPLAAFLPFSQFR